MEKAFRKRSMPTKKGYTGRVKDTGLADEDEFGG